MIMKHAESCRHNFWPKLTYKACSHYSQPIIESITMAGVSHTECVISNTIIPNTPTYAMQAISESVT